jgi:hypothetical protein
MFAATSMRNYLITRMKMRDTWMSSFQVTIDCCEIKVQNACRHLQDSIRYFMKMKSCFNDTTGNITFFEVSHIKFINKSADSSIIIPCTVTNPMERVQLYKLNDEVCCLNLNNRQYIQFSEQFTNCKFPTFP